MLIMKLLSARVPAPLKIEFDWIFFGIYGLYMGSCIVSAESDYLAVI